MAEGASRMHRQGRRGRLLLRRRDRQPVGHAHPRTERSGGVLRQRTAGRGGGEDQGDAPHPLRREGRPHQRRHPRVRSRPQGQPRELPNVHLPRHAARLQQRHHSALRQSRRRPRLAADHGLLQEESTRLKQDRKKLSRVPRFGFTVIAALLLALLARTPARGEPAGNLILGGAAIYTLDAARPLASALVIQNGRIGYVGDDTGALAFAGPGTRALALGGRMVIPGFHDSHIHPMTGGMRLLRCRLNDFRAAQQVYAAVRACAAAKPKGTWLLGGGWSPEAFARGGPSRRKLDELVPDRPALLTTEDGYTAWVNTSALALAGIATDSSDSQVEGIERDPTTHKPTGILKDEAVGFVRRHAPQPTEAEYREALRRSTAIANRFGITSLVDANASEPVLDAYRAAEVAGELTVRVVAAQRIDLSRGVEQIEELLARRDRVRGRRLRSDAAKLFLDGEIDRHTAAMLDPYEGAAGVRGNLLVKPEALAALVRRLDA